jgi:hypothetical protein
MCHISLLKHTMLKLLLKKWVGVMTSEYDDMINYLGSFNPFDVFDTGFYVGDIPNELIGDHHIHNQNYDFSDIQNIIISSGVSWSSSVGWNCIVDYADKYISKEVVREAILEALFNQKSHDKILKIVFDLTVISIAHHAAQIEKLSFRRKWNNLASGLVHALSGEGNIVEGASIAQQNYFNESLPKLSSVMPMSLVLNLCFRFSAISKKECSDILDKCVLNTCIDYKQMRPFSKHPIGNIPICTIINNYNKFVKYLDKEYGRYKYFNGMHNLNDFSEAEESPYWGLSS